MKYNHAKTIFLFSDESGDVGDPLKSNDSSDNFIINIAVATDGGVAELDSLVSEFKTFTDYKKELKNIKKNRLKPIVKGLQYLTEVIFYEITIPKRKYNGPYLRNANGYTQNQRMFRNFILGIALEFITHSENLFTIQKPLELVIDRYLTNQDHEKNLKEYLIKKSFIGRLPKFQHILQVDSRYCTPIQVLDVIQKIKNIDDIREDLCKSIPVPTSLLTTRK